MKKSYFPYLTALLLFGSNGIVASHISLASDQIVWLRTLLGSALLLPLFLLTRHRFSFFRYRRDGLRICLSGMAMGVSWMLLYAAYARVGVGIASLLYYCGPVIVMVLSPLLFQEKLTAGKLTGFAAVLCGVLLVNGQAAEKPNASGVLCGLLAAALYAFMVIINKKSRHIAGMENALLQLCVSFLTVSVCTGVKNGGFAMRIAPDEWIWILILGFLNTGIGCYLYFASIGGLPVQTIAVCGYLEPLSAVVFSVLLLGESLLPGQVLGAALIIGGAVWGECAHRPRSRAAPEGRELSRHGR